MVRETIEKGEPWVDTKFPPERTSLYDPAIDQVNHSTYDAYIWKRASEIYRPVHIFEDGIEPNDVN